MQEEEPRAHARFAPSSACAWRLCPGYVTANELYEDTAGPEAAQGTLFHLICEIGQEIGAMPWHMETGTVMHIDGHDVVCDQEMLNHAAHGLAWLEELAPNGVTPEVEIRVPLENYTLEKDGFGTSDNGYHSVEERVVGISDWKYGYVAVVPYENSQLVLYFAGYWELLAAKDFEDVDPEDITAELSIYQPRAATGGGTWTTTVANVLRLAAEIREDARRAHENPNLRIAGESQCVYCSHIDNCVEHRAWKNEQTAGLFDNLEEMYDPAAPVKTPTMTLEEKAAFVRVFPYLEKLKDRIKKEAAAALKHGQPAPGFKRIIGKRGNKHFKTKNLAEAEEILQDCLQDGAYNKTLLTPTQAKNELKRLSRDEPSLGTVYADLLDPLVDQAPGKPTVVFDDDSREKVSAAADLFIDIDDI